MRKLFYILASILFTFSTNAEEVKWEWMGLVHNPVPGYAYNKVFAIGKDTVFLVGEQGVVLRSLNGLLESWDIQNLPDKPKLTGIHFRNAHEGYLVGGKRIYRTQDGGENWLSVYEDGTEVLSAVCCVGTNTVRAVGTNGLILKSQDNGETWQKVKLVGVDASLTGVSINAKGFGFITGSKYTLLTTYDNGNTWETKSVSNNPGTSTDICTNPQVGDSIGVYCLDNKFYYHNFLTQQTTENGYNSYFDLYLKNDTTIIMGTLAFTTCGGGGFFILKNTYKDGEFEEEFIQIYNGSGVYNAESLPSIHYGDPKTGYITHYGSVCRTIPQGYELPPILIPNVPEMKVEDVVYSIQGDELQIEQSKYPLNQLSLFDMNGRKLIDKQLSLKDKVDISSLSKGVYIVRLNYENNRSYSFKISVP